MNPTPDTATEPVALSLEGRLGIADAAALRQELLAARASGNRLSLHCQKLESMDVAILQLLVAAQRSFDEITIESPEAGFCESFQRAALPPISKPPKH